MNEEDLRVQRTRRLLREAFIELVEQKGYDPITIREITQQAQVGYKTFFRHYESKEALLQSLVIDLLEKFQRVRLAPNQANAPEQNTRTVLQLARENKELLRTIMHSPAADQLSVPITRFATEEGLLTFQQTGIPAPLVASHFAHSMLNAVMWWLEEGDDYSIDDMVNFLSQLVLDPLKRLSA